MKKFKQFILEIMSTRLGFLLTLVGFYWLKTMWANTVDFNLGLENPYQFFLTLINPIPISLLLIGLALYIKNTKLFYSATLIMYALLNLLLIANAIYFREFSDFITINTMLATSKVSAGLGDSAINLLRPWDLVYLLDAFILVFLLVKRYISFDNRSFNKRASFAVTALSALLFSVNLFLAEIDRPELLSRGFSNTYVVRALGINAFLGYDANQTYQTQKVRAEAKPEEIETVKAYVNQHYVEPNPNYFGLAKDRNVIIIHLESFQQFLIDYKLTVDNRQYEVTPFINSLYHSNQTFSFSNFFHQVKAGKTSDSETLMETSLFGLNQGSFFVQYGGDNTQQAAPHILAENGNYTSAVFHGNIATFWNRNNVYKALDYDYFFDQSYMSKATDDNSFQYGLNDKIMFSDSIKYLEHMQQPFYTKFITVSNHYPYQNLSGDEVGFPLAQTDDETINGYFATANYLDAAVKSFFDYLKASGLYDNSIILLYGDHYGISNSRNPSLAELLGKDSETWSEYDNAMLQRVPYMIHVPGTDKGFISETYGGEVDNLPTLLHLLGIDTKQYIQLGQDLLSKDNSQVVALRTSGYFITPHYTSYGGRLYNTVTGEEITNPDENTSLVIDEIRNIAKTQLDISDSIQTGDLLRFYKDSGLTPVDSSNISYNDSFEILRQIEEELGDMSTSLYNQNNNTSTQELYNAPSYSELHPDLPENTEIDENTTHSSTLEE
ncbi:LTA synthase family protein [Streptococcus zalophi]|uniref:LTA synthase family protein n=1 Tax=Streptococcus zalophi TaxID=640031 RepID=A0A934UCW2_9STRE|nr:LTA synthase family protein [Streptococcus zalophi]MBJ8349140.1 LTA synthase family protein [Streptococcus zalophi]MCR8967708.1 LTA synthase family protein [Streptococcus zalophi]